MRQQLVVDAQETECENRQPTVATMDCHVHQPLSLLEQRPRQRQALLDDVEHVVAVVVAETSIVDEHEQVEPLVALAVLVAVVVVLVVVVLVLVAVVPAVLALAVRGDVLPMSSEYVFLAHEVASLIDKLYQGHRRDAYYENNE